MEILKSASKMVLLGVVACMIVITMAVVFKNLNDAEMAKTVITIFSSSVLLVLGFYFGNKTK